MYPGMQEIPCTSMRGGTSKGIFMMTHELPSDPKKRDEEICRIFGSPDVRQIDGLGGADVLTSKLALISPSDRPDADVEYTFGQVSFEEEMIDYKGNCGNISAAVGPYAIDKGLVKAVEPVTTVRIYLTNSGKILTEEVPVKDGKPLVYGDCRIDGVPGTGARIDIDWSEIVGTFSGSLLPTGSVVDEFTIDGKKYPVSLVDAGNPLVFIAAESLGMKGTETPAEIEGDPALMEKIEKIRSRAAVLFHLVNCEKDAYDKSPYIPFFAIVSRPADYTCFNGTEVKAEDVDLVSRLLFMHHMHKAYPITGTVCTGSAMKIPGTIPWQMMTAEARERTALRIGHPTGSLEVKVDSDTESTPVKIKYVKVFRTARKIMDGTVYIRE